MKGTKLLSSFLRSYKAQKIYELMLRALAGNISSNALHHLKIVNTKLDISV